MIVALEQPPHAVPDLTAHLLSRREVLRRQLESGAHVVDDVDAALVDLVESRVHLRDEPEPAQREERRPPDRQIELHLLDVDAFVLQPEDRVATDRLDLLVDTDTRDVAAIRDSHPTTRSLLHRGDEVPPRRRLRERRERTRTAHRLQHQRDVLRRSRHRAGDLKRVPDVVGRMRRHESRRRP
jgi:hypothetical protein